MSWAASSFTLPHFAVASAGTIGGQYTVPKANMKHVIRVFEGSYITLLGRIEDSANDAIQQADVSRITLRVYATPRAEPTKEVHSETLTIASVIFDTLQTDSRWRGDALGYNFRATLTSPQVFANSGSIHTVSVTVETVTEGPARQQWEVQTVTDMGVSP